MPAAGLPGGADEQRVIQQLAQHDTAGQLTFGRVEDVNQVTKRGYEEDQHAFQSVRAFAAQRKQQGNQQNQSAAADQARFNAEPEKGFSAGQVDQAKTLSAPASRSSPLRKMSRLVRRPLSRSVSKPALSQIRVSRVSVWKTGGKNGQARHNPDG